MSSRGQEKTDATTPTETTARSEKAGAIDLDLPEKSFQAIAPQAAEFVAAFYDRLFDAYAELKKLFSHTDMAAQQKKLLSALVLVMENLRDAGKLQEALLVLGQKHKGYSVVAHHYPLVGDALLRTFAAFMGDQWTVDVETAWTRAYAMISQTMLRGYALNDEA